MPPHVAELFAPRPPLKFLPPIDIEPGKRSTPAISGVAQYLSILNTVDDNYTPTESWLQKQQREKKERAIQYQKELEEKIKNWNPNTDPQVRGDAYKTLFIARLSYEVVEGDLEKEFSRFGPIERIRVVREQETNKSRGYAFIVFERERDLKVAYNSADGISIKGRKILVDVERGRTVKSWKPRMLGGGLGGRHYTKPHLLRTLAGNGRDFRASDRGGFGGRGRGGYNGSSGGYRGGSRRGGDDRYSGQRRFDDRRETRRDDRRDDRGGDRRSDYRDRRDYQSSGSRYDDRRSGDRDRGGRRDYRDRSPGRRY